MKTILGIDPGLRHTGWGVIQSNGHALHFVACGAIHPKANDDLPKRLHFLHMQLSTVIERFKPQTAAIEQTFVSINASSTLKLGNARGALVLSLAIHDLFAAEYDATLIKKTVTGSGRADKGQMERMVRILLPACAQPESADAIDALAVAITHAHHDLTASAFNV